MKKNSVPYNNFLSRLGGIPSRTQTSSWPHIQHPHTKKWIPLVFLGQVNTKGSIVEMYSGAADDFILPRNDWEQGVNLAIARKEEPFSWVSYQPVKNPISVNEHFAVSLPESKKEILFDEKWLEDLEELEEAGYELVLSIEPLLSPLNDEEMYFRYLFYSPKENDFRLLTEE